MQAKAKTPRAKAKAMPKVKAKASSSMAIAITVASTDIRSQIARSRSHRLEGSQKQITPQCRRCRPQPQLCKEDLMLEESHR